MIANIINGIKAYAKAMPLLLTLKLWKYFVIPMLISLTTLVVISSFAYSLSDAIGHYIANFWKWELGKETFEIISRFFSGLLILVFGLLIYKHIVLALSSPFMSPVSEKIEEYLYGRNHEHRTTSFKDQLVRGIRISLRNITKELMITIPILLLSVIPILGFFSTVFLFLIQAYYAGFGNIDYTLERHYNYKESIDFVSKNKGIAIGNGIIFILFLLIPVVGVIFILPLSVTAATTETTRKIYTKE